MMSNQAFHYWDDAQPGFLPGISGIIPPMPSTPMRHNRGTKTNEH